VHITSAPVSALSRSRRREVEVNISVSERWLTPYAPPGVGSRASSKKIREGIHVRVSSRSAVLGLLAAAAAMTLGTPPYGETIK